MKLTAGSTYGALEKHCRDFLATWSRITGNVTDSRDSLETFYMQLLSSLPSQPEGAHLSSVRKWLAEQMTVSSPVLVDADDTVDKLLKYAAIIGVPRVKAVIAANQDSVIFGSCHNLAPWVSRRGSCHAARSQ